MQWIATGTTSATVSYFLIGWMFGVPMPWPATLGVPVLIAATSCSCYALGLLLAAFSLRKADLRNLVSNLGYLTLMAVTGAGVPTTFWPDPVPAVASILPMTHALGAIRSIAGGGGVTALMTGVLAELAVAFGWLVVAAAALTHFAESGRRDGSIEFG